MKLAIRWHVLLLVQESKRSVFLWSISCIHRCYIQSLRLLMTRFIRHHERSLSHSNGWLWAFLESDVRGQSGWLAFLTRQFVRLFISNDSFIFEIKDVDKVVLDWRWPFRLVLVFSNDCPLWLNLSLAWIIIGFWRTIQIMPFWAHQRMFLIYCVASCFSICV